MTETHLCDYCRATIDTRTDAPLIVAVHRRVDTEEWGDSPDMLASGEQLVFRYCDQQHLSQHMQRTPLPPVRRDDELPSGGAVIGFLAVAIVMLGLLALTVYGGVQFWHDSAADWF